MRDVTGGPDVETITTPQVIVGYQPTDEDLEVFRQMIYLMDGAFPWWQMKAHALGRRIFGVKY